MIVALLILIVLILLFGAAAVKSAMARTLIFVVAICVVGVGIGSLQDAIGEDALAYLLTIGAAVLIIGGALILAVTSLPDSTFRKGLRRRANKRRRQRLGENEPR